MGIESHTQSKEVFILMGFGDGLGDTPMAGFFLRCHGGLKCFLAETLSRNSLLQNGDMLL